MCSVELSRLSACAAYVLIDLETYLWNVWEVTESIVWRYTAGACFLVIRRGALVVGKGTEIDSSCICVISKSRVTLSIRSFISWLCRWFKLSLSCAPAQSTHSWWAAFMEAYSHRRVLKLPSVSILWGNMPVLSLVDNCASVESENVTQTVSHRTLGKDGYAPTD